MARESLIRPKDFGRLVLACLAALTAAIGLQLVFGCASGSMVGSAALWLWMLAQWPFARMRLQLRRAFSRKRRNAYADYFRN